MVPGDVVGPAPYSLLFGEGYAQPLLPQPEVGFAGQVVAAVVAETPELAADAAEAVVVEITPTEPLLDIDAALERSVIEQTRKMSPQVPERFDPAKPDSEVVI